MPGATELPRVWARVSPRVTPCASPRASPRVSPRVTHHIWKPLVFLVFSEKTKHTPQTPLSIQGQRHPTRHTKEAYKGPYKEATPYSHNPGSLLSLIFPLFTLPLNSRMRADRCARPCWECLRGLSTVSNLEECVSLKAGEKKPTPMSPLPKATASNKQISMGNVLAKCQNSRFVAKRLDTRRVSQARQAPGPR